MKYLNVIGIVLLFAFAAIFIISAEDKNIYAFGSGELCAFAGIACIAIKSRYEKMQKI